MAQTHAYGGRFDLDQPENQKTLTMKEVPSTLCLVIVPPLCWMQPVMPLTLFVGIWNPIGANWDHGFLPVLQHQVFFRLVGPIWHNSGSLFTSASRYQRWQGAWHNMTMISKHPSTLGQAAISSTSCLWTFSAFLLNMQRHLSISGQWQCLMFLAKDYDYADKHPTPEALVPSILSKSLPEKVLKSSKMARPPVPGPKCNQAAMLWQRSVQRILQFQLE